MSDPLEAAFIANGSMLTGYLIVWLFVGERPSLPLWMVLLWIAGFAWGLLT